MAKGKTTKTQPAVNSERAIVRNLVDNIITRLNNSLISFDQTHRYKIEWVKGTGYIDNGYERTKSYYKLEVTIVESDGSIINIYGDNHPIPSGTSQLRVLEAELQAYKNFLMHGVGALISVQHSTFLQAEANERNAKLEEEKNNNKSNLIL